MASQVNSTNLTKRTYTDPSQNLPKTEEEGGTPKTFYEAIITQMQKPDKDITKKKKIRRPISLTSIDI